VVLSAGLRLDRTRSVVSAGATKCGSGEGLRRRRPRKPFVAKRGVRGGNGWSFYGGAVLIGVESAEAASPPGCGQLRGRSFIALFAEAKLVGDFEEGAEERRAIVAGEIDEAGLLDETAELDEVARARPSILHRLPRIGAGAGSIEAVPLHGQTLELAAGHLEVREQDRRLKFSSRAWCRSERSSGLALWPVNHVTSMPNSKPSWTKPARSH
jgi:hypothetical protein